MNMALAPSIDSIEICRDEQDLPRQLRLRGSNLLAGNYHVIVDGTYSTGQPESGPEAAVALVRIPDPKSFAYKRSHSLIFTTPHGMAIKQF